MGKFIFIIILTASMNVFAFEEIQFSGETAEAICSEFNKINTVEKKYNVAVEEQSILEFNETLRLESQVIVCRKEEGAYIAIIKYKPEDLK